MFQKLEFKARVNINLDIFGAQARDEEYTLGFSLPLCDAQRGTSWNYSTSETVRRDTGTDKWGEEGKYCSQGERRANNQGFWSRTARGSAVDQLRSVTEPPRLKTGSLGCCCRCCCLFCTVPSRMSSDTETHAGKSQSSHGYTSRRKTGSKMQGLSSRAHAFSVEALVGKPCKRMKVSDGHESNLAADTASDTSIFAGEEDLWISENISLF